MGQLKPSYTDGDDANDIGILESNLAGFKLIDFNSFRTVLGLQRNWADDTEFPSTPTDNFPYCDTSYVRYC